MVTSPVVTVTPVSDGAVDDDEGQVPRVWLSVRLVSTDTPVDETSPVQTETVAVVPPTFTPTWTGGGSTDGGFPAGTSPGVIDGGVTRLYTPRPSMQAAALASARCTWTAVRPVAAAAWNADSTPWPAAARCHLLTASAASPIGIGTTTRRRLEPRS